MSFSSISGILFTRTACRSITHFSASMGATYRRAFSLNRHSSCCGTEALCATHPSSSLLPVSRAPPVACTPESCWRCPSEPSTSQAPPSSHAFLSARRSTRHRTHFHINRRGAVATATTTATSTMSTLTSSVALTYSLPTRPPATAVASRPKPSRLQLPAPPHTPTHTGTSHSLAPTRPASTPSWSPFASLSPRRRLATRSSSASSATTEGSGPEAAAAATEAAVVVEGLGQLKRKVAEAQSRLSSALAVADKGGCRLQLAALEDEAAAAGAGLWEQPGRAGALMGAMEALRSELTELGRYQSQLEEAAFAVELIEAEEAPGGMLTGEQAALAVEAVRALDHLNRGLDSWELRRLLSGPWDERGARIVISAGAGGVDAQDWAEMLERMYCRWAEQAGYGVRVLERSEGEEAGIKSSELEVSGRYAYGYLRGEKGTHRLVRNSPFNAKGLRQTSFAGVDIMPLLAASDLPEMDLREVDLQISTMRSGGKGGQNVNKVETGVRILHLPTGLSVKCTQERSQLANRAIAMEILKARLAVVLEEQNAKRLAEIRGELVKAEWGQQIRNYVLHPYKLVKDTRTGHETSDVAGVLEGGALQSFMAAWLRHKGRRDVVSSGGVWEEATAGRGPGSGAGGGGGGR